MDRAWLEKALAVAHQERDQMMANANVAIGKVAVLERLLLDLDAARGPFAEPDTPAQPPVPTPLVRKKADAAAQDSA